MSHLEKNAPAAFILILRVFKFRGNNSDTLLRMNKFQFTNITKTQTLRDNIKSKIILIISFDPFYQNLSSLLAIYYSLIFERE